MEVQQCNEKSIDKDVREKVIMYEVFKRVIDILGSLFSIILTLPVFIIIAVIIKIDSPGPIFFMHRRYGRHGKIIKILKFRSMYKDAESMKRKFTAKQREEFQKNFKLRNDPRVTKVGRILRKTSLDELPQMVNILIGNMSFVGPRPIVMEELEKYGDCGSKLLSVKPGLTGLWQVCGRSTTTYKQRVELDMKYIDSRTIIGDLLIISKTFEAVWRKIGAF